MPLLEESVEGKGGEKTESGLPRAEEKRVARGLVREPSLFDAHSCWVVLDTERGNKGAGRWKEGMLRLSRSNPSSRSRNSLSLGSSQPDEHQCTLYLIHQLLREHTASPVRHSSQPAPSRSARQRPQHSSRRRSSVAKRGGATPACPSAVLLLVRYWGAHQLARPRLPHEGVWTNLDRKSVV